MKVFISSVRRGLEAERDSLPGLIAAVGFEPVRFEDFTALPTPSREACMRGVAASDVYLLLLGPHYGHVFPETGQSATHDEWVAATTKGISRLVFRKSGVSFEPEQEQFASVVADYGAGVFYDQFETAVDLQAKVARALRALAESPSALDFQPLTQPIDIRWRTRSSSDERAGQRTLLTVHVVPLGTPPLSRRVLAETETRLMQDVRRIGAVPVAAGVSTSSDAAGVSLTWPEQQSQGFDRVRRGELVELHVSPGGQLSWSWTLPGDGLGTILNEADLVERIGTSLRHTSSLKLMNASRYAVAVELTAVQLASEADIAPTPRQQASFGIRQDPTVRVEPDESMSDAALSVGATEAAVVAARALLARFRASR